MARSRGSISAQSVSLTRPRNASSIAVNRLRSDSATQSDQEELNDDAEFLSHPVEPRARTSQLPPVMVRLSYQKSSFTC